MTKATIQNLTPSPHDVETLSGPAVLPAAVPGDDSSGFLTADFPDHFLDVCDAVPFFKVMRGEVPAPKATLPGLPLPPASTLPGLPDLPIPPAAADKPKGRGRPKKAG